MVTITAFKMVPPFAQGVVRDLRPRWALEEAGIPYDVELIDQDVQASSSYRAEQPFGQVPIMRDEGLTLFESGAIVLHIANKSSVLMPPDEAGQARATAWVVAALNSIEPFIMNLAEIDFFPGDAEVKKARRPDVVQTIERRLGDLAKWIGDRPYLEDRFTVGDLLMTTVLRILRHTDILEKIPNLADYRARHEARPAFQRALDAQMAVFQAHAA